MLTEQEGNGVIAHSMHFISLLWWWMHCMNTIRGYTSNKCFYLYPWNLTEHDYRYTVSVCVYARVLHNKIYTNLAERHHAMRIYSNPLNSRKRKSGHRRAVTLLRWSRDACRWLNRTSMQINAFKRCLYRYFSDTRVFNLQWFPVDGWIELTNSRWWINTAF